jgi:hypothetical protein
MSQRKANENGPFAQKCRFCRKPSLVAFHVMTTELETRFICLDCFGDLCTQLVMPPGAYMIASIFGDSDDVHREIAARTTAMIARGRFPNGCGHLPRPNVCGGCALDAEDY